MKKHILFLLTFILVVVSFGMISCNDSDNTNKNSASKYLGIDLFYKVPAHSDIIYRISAKSMTAQEIEMIVSLQGIVAKQSASIFIDDRDESYFWLNQCIEQYGITVKSVSNAWELVSLFKDRIQDGKYVLYTSTSDVGASEYEQSINYATTVAGAEGYLMIATGIESRAVEAGLTLGKDVRKSNTESIFNEYKDKLNNSALVHQIPSKWQLRDYAIASGIMCYYSDYNDGISMKDEILSWAEENAPVYGWTKDELNFVTSNSLHSKITIAADWATNLSLYSSFSEKSEYKQPETETPDVKQKHYVAIIMSDGDNLQWMLNGFSTDSRYYGSKYRGTFPMTWTIAPSLYNLAPQVLNYLYDNATDNDSFVAGPSGIGYVNLTGYNENSRESYAELTANYLKATDLSYVNLLDSAVNAEALTELSRYDAVKGGVWSVGNLYVEGGGEVYFVNDKPFVCVRETLWHIDGDDNTNQSYGYVERVAQRINNYKIDPTSIEGYTIIIAHAWSIGSMTHIARFVELLDDDIELVTVPQLLELVAENVPHENMI